MRLYLVRHGKAVTEEENPERPLSEHGRQDVAKMASFLARSGTKAVRVVHSGLVRAAETALILAETVGPGRLVEEMSGLAPMDHPKALVKAAHAWTDDTMVCGHLPHLGRVASVLLAGDDRLPIVHFPTSGALCLERDDESGTFTIRWFATPRLLGG